MLSRLGSLLGLTFLARPWRIAVYALVGLALGLAIVIARISNASSYLSNSPQTCINCHVMTDAYASWQRGSHGGVTVCVDCHVPHDNPVAKIAYKSTDGLKHSAVFTMRAEPQVLRLSAQAVPVVQANCLRCHADQMGMVRVAGSGERACWHCHNNIHGSVHSLSASPRALRPQLPRAGLKLFAPENEKGGQP